MALTLRNPHSVLAALDTRPQDVLEVHLAPRAGNDTWHEVAGIAAQRGISVLRTAPQARGGGGGRRSKQQSADGGRTGGCTAVVRERESSSLENLFNSDDTRGLWLALDCLQDPHNVGAVFRTAGFFGVRGIVTTTDRSCPLSATVYDVASGGLEAVPFSQQTNLSRAISTAKEQGMWVLGTSEHAEMDIREVDLDRRWLLVLGNEEKGIRRLTEKNCDQLCGVQSQGAIGSLNVSVAAGVMIATLTRPA